MSAPSGSHRVRHFTGKALENPNLSRRLQAEISDHLFHGFDDDFWHHLLVRPDAEQIDLYVLEQKDGTWTGFVIVQAYRMTIENKERVVLRSAVGMMPGARGGLTTRIALMHALRYKLAHPLTELWYSSRLSSPAAYHLFNRVLWRIYPRPGKSIPAVEQAFLRKLAAIVGYTIVDQAERDVLITEESVAVKAPESEQDYWLGSDLPDVRWYLKVTGFPHQRRSVLIGVPLTWVDIFGSFAKSVWDRFFRRKRLRATTQHVTAN